MKTLANKGLYIGTGAGLVLFTLIGLLPGSLIGGVIGLKLSALLFGVPFVSEILPRIILALSMLTGVMASATVFVVGSGFAGYSIGYLLEGKKKEVVAEEIVLS